MSVKLIIGENILEPSTWEHFETDNPCDFIVDRFKTLPEGARFYHNSVDQTSEIIVTNEREFEQLNELEDTIIMVVCPGYEAVVAIIVIVVAIVVAVVFAPSVPNTQAPTAAQRNRRTESSNNELSDRENRARPNSRIPDIFGTVRSTPDLLSVPLQVYENNIQVELAYMCIGRSSYAVDGTKIFDDVTPVQQISGTTVEIYSPNTSPNSGDAPQLRVGSPIDQKVKNVHKSSAVNGQTLRAPNSANVTGTNDFYFKYADEINTTGDYNLDDRFISGDDVVVTNATDTLTLVTSGSELVTNGNFDSGTTGWTLGSGWAYGTQEIVKTAGTSSNASTDVFVAGGQSIDTTFDVSTYTAGEVYIRLSNNGAEPFTNGTVRTSAGTFNEALLAQPGQNQLDIVANDLFDGAVDSVSATDPVGSTSVTVDLSGTYTVLNVSSSQIVLSNPEAVNTDWAVMGASTEGETSNLSPSIESISDKWVGPFTMDVETTDEIIANFVATNGLYKDDGTTQVKIDVEMEIEVTPVDASGTPTGSPETFQATVLGSESTTSERAVSLYAEPSVIGRFRVRARRVTETDTAFKGTVVDEIKWRDLYALSDPGVTEFGNITTVWSKTIATTGALSIKSRKLNMDVTREIPVRVSGTTFTAPQASSRVSDIFVAASTDQYIGNRSLDELDLDNIYDTIDEVETYFGTDKSVEFGYTFDSDNMSYEETASSIAATAFCTAYRQGSAIKLSFEKETEDSVLLFNHRNKMPNSETRTVSFGNRGDNDGVELEYVNPKDGAIETFYVPPNQTAINPKKVETIGIKSKLLAHFQAWRAYNKILKQNTAVEFQATQEAAVLVLNDRILVADNTRPNTQDGEVESYSNLTVSTSQPMQTDPTKTYFMFLQHIDGTVESIEVASFPSIYEAVLTQAPRMALATDINNYARATYWLVEEQNTAKGAFLLTEKDMQGNMTAICRAINYDDAFYANDKDFINGVVDENGDYI